MTRAICRSRFPINLDPGRQLIIERAQFDRLPGSLFDKASNPLSIVKHVPNDIAICGRSNKARIPIFGRGLKNSLSTHAVTRYFNSLSP
ncbi:hypothetical protein [Sinorhizobium meliloti]|uniref:hypothetical protein n=1 Tax=Rhizobium meliloti TaxID=382 RepID=UPI000FD81AE8|nr:hypothetical protein [Sinorhizobium meliloti]RVP99664.1 hypothetical protein CN070_17015 [Sinorhizobium meliloti]